MRTSFLHSRRLGDYTSVPFEIFIAVFSILPFFVLAYYYPALPERVPLFLNSRGDVGVWSEKSLLAVFRLPLMALVLQALCLLMKYGILQSKTILPVKGAEDYARLQKQSVVLSVGLWDWFRCLIAFKVSASSFVIVFLSIERLRFLATPALLLTGIAALLSLAGALFYGYRLLAVKREMKKRFGEVKTQGQIDAEHVYGGVILFQPF